MNTNRWPARLVGIFFIVAAVASIIGLILYDPILKGSDYLAVGAANDKQILLGALMELLLVISAVGTAVTMFPVLRAQSERIALWHLCFRFLEAVVITIGIISVLALLTLGRAYTAEAAPDRAAYQAVGTALRAIHDWTFLLGPNFMLGINTIMYSFLFFRSRLVPRWLATLGMTGATLVFVAALLELFGVIEQISLWGALLSIPVALNEMSLAVWLIAKGFNTPKTTSGAPYTPANEMLRPA